MKCCVSLVFTCSEVDDDRQRACSRTRLVPCAEWEVAYKKAQNCQLDNLLMKLDE